MESSSDLSYDKYPFLKEIGIDRENLGCYNGKTWSGNGANVSSINPSTGKVLYKFYIL